MRSSDGNEGDWVTPISLRNTSGSSCRLDGWPGLEFFGVNEISVCTSISPGVTVTGPTCPPPADHTTIQPVTVSRTGNAREMVLLAGEHTDFAILWTIGYSGFCTSTKALIEPYGVRIRVPGDSRPLTVLMGSTDDIQMCGQEVEATAFGAS